MTIWHYDRHCRPAGTVDIGLIKDEANVAVPHRGSRIKVPPLSENLKDTVELAQRDDTIVPEHVDPNWASS